MKQIKETNTVSELRKARRAWEEAAALAEDSTLPARERARWRRRARAQGRRAVRLSQQNQQSTPSTGGPEQ